MSEFRGAIAATITPFTPKGQLNEEVFRGVMESNIEAGVDGFWVSGGTGESVLLTQEEVIRTAELASEVAAGRAKTIVHVGALTTDSAVRKAKAVGKSGADAICCVPPFFYQTSTQGIVDHYRAVADAAGLPFLIYNTPKYTHMEFSVPMMEEMVKAIPQLVGLKHGGDFNNIRRFAEMGLDVLTGNGALFLQALTARGVGVVDGPLTVAPEIWVDIYRAYKDRDISRAEEAQGRANKLNDLVARFGTQASCKTLTSARLGLDCGVPRRPISPLSEEQTRELLNAAEALGVLKAPQLST